MRMKWNSLGATICAGLFAVTLVAAPNTVTRIDKKKSAEATMRGTWPPETFSGKVMIVEPGRKLVVVKGPDGVPFDIRVTPSTRIRSGDRNLALKDLTDHENVSVRFVPKRSGDIARSIEVTG
jgi:hypothetical protein